MGDVVVDVEPCCQQGGLAASDFSVKGGRRADGRPKAMIRDLLEVRPVAFGEADIAVVLLR
jgi:hypothetical protein